MLYKGYYAIKPKQTIKQSIWPRDRTLSGASTPGQFGPRCDGSERVIRVPQSITEASPSDCFVSYQDTRWESLTPLQRWSQYILSPQLTAILLKH